MAAQRSAVLPQGALAEYLAKHCFAQGQQYLTEVDGGLFARLVVEGQDVIIYEVEDRENA